MSAEMSGADIFFSFVFGVLIFLSHALACRIFCAGRSSQRKRSNNLREREDELLQLQLSRLRDQMAEFIDCERIVKCILRHGGECLGTRTN